MAKKKILEPVTIHDEAAKSEPAEYTTSTWSGMKQYSCTSCAFDALNLPAMFDHLYQAHGIQVTGYEPPPSPPSPPEEEGKKDVFEVELKEIGEEVDEQGNVRKKYTIKE